MERFYWLEETSIAGCSRPGGAEDAWRRQDGSSGGLDALHRDLAWLAAHEIGALLSLTETPLLDEAVLQHGLEAFHLPVPDLTAPLPAQFECALDFIDWQRSLGRAVAVHCLMGQGRTGSILAAYRIRGGLSADEAIAEMRAICPGALSSPEQEHALYAFSDRRDWIL